MNEFIKVVKEENKRLDDLDTMPIEEPAKTIATESIQTYFRYKLYLSLLPFNLPHEEKDHKKTS